MEKAVAVTDGERLSALREAEGKIRKACLRGRDLTREIAQQLITIREGELWRAVKDDRDFECRSFGDYVEEVLGWEHDAVARYMRAESTFQLLEQANLSLPENESQAIALSRLDDEHQPIVWRRVLETSNGQENITTAKVRFAVTQEQEDLREEQREREALAKRKRAKGGVEVDMGGEAPEQISLSERGEEALARIKSVCGPEVAEAIANKSVAITEEAIRLWGEQEDAEVVCALSHYVVERGWKVRKALNYMSKLVDGDTTIDELILMARERKGRMAVMHDDARVVIEIMVTSAR